MSGATTPPTKMSRDSILTDLQSIVGTEHVGSGAEAGLFVVDENHPHVVVHPGTYEEVASVMSFANNHGLAVIPWGIGNQMHLGNVPRKYEIALSLSRLAAIIEHEPADLTVTCQAGMHASKLAERLGESSQLVPFRISITPFGTVGGMLASGNHGSPRDFTIGMRIVTTDGRITRAGGGVVKNVAGYDLCKLYIGSRGTLGVIVEATFKLQPLPQATENFDLEFDSVHAACNFVSQGQKKGIDMHNAILTKLQIDYVPIGGYRVRAEIGSTATAVDRCRQEISELAARQGGQPFDARRFEQGSSDVPDWILQGDRLACSIRVLASDTGRLFEALQAEGRSPIILAWPTTGEIEATWLGVIDQWSLLERLRKTVMRAGATLAVTHCDPELKRKIDVFDEVPAKTLDLMRRIKQQFDPKGTLSPGRFVGRL
ncbi:MAG TPA: FAD-binding oxidoreductase [Dehalococcoidia bacterium]|nr:FAD-binding oxidoreductase [Dehalococcoidia bacterium]